MENLMKKELVIIGGGPAGMAAAVAAHEAGIRDILILERDEALGGILRQCIHNGFGLHRFGEELTGPEYAYRYEVQVRELGIPFMLDTMVIEVSDDRKVTAMNRELGIFTVEAGAVILAMGCRERPKGALNIAGRRPAGIYTAGTAQKFEGGKIAVGKYVSSFVGFFPAQKPKYLALVIVDEPQGAYYGSVVAAPVAKEVFEGIISLKNIKPYI